MRYGLMSILFLLTLLGWWRLVQAGDTLWSLKWSTGHSLHVVCQVKAAHLDSQGNVIGPLPLYERGSDLTDVPCFAYACIIQALYKEMLAHPEWGSMPEAILFCWRDDVCSQQTDFKPLEMNCDTIS